MGRIIPYIMENKKCLKPPARLLNLVFGDRRSLTRTSRPNPASAGGIRAPGMSLDMVSAS